MSSVGEVARGIVFDVLGPVNGVPSAVELKDDLLLGEDLFADELDLVEITIGLELAFGFEVPVEMVEVFESVGDVVGFAQGLVEQGV